MKYSRRIRQPQTNKITPKIRNNKEASCCAHLYLLIYKTFYKNGIDIKPKGLKRQTES